MDKEAAVYTFNEILLSHKKEHIWVSGDEVDEPRAYYKQWCKSEREKHISHINAYIRNLKRWYWWAYLQGNNGDTDIEIRFMDSGVGRKERMGRMERVA